MNVVRIEDDTLSESEREIVDRIGIKNLDYCVAAIVQERNPGEEVTYLESENAFKVGENTFELQFEITSDEPDYETVGRHVQTLELLFDVAS